MKLRRFLKAFAFFVLGLVMMFFQRTHVPAKKNISEHKQEAPVSIQMTREDLAVHVRLETSSLASSEVRVEIYGLDGLVFARGSNFSESYTSWNPGDVKTYDVALGNTEGLLAVRVSGIFGDTGRSSAVRTLRIAEVLVDERDVTEPSPMMDGKYVHLLPLNP